MPHEVELCALGVSQQCTQSMIVSLSFRDRNWDLELQRFGQVPDAREKGFPREN